MTAALRVAWVTGGGTGIGRSLAIALYREGYRVAISGRRSEPLHQVVKELSDAKGLGDIWAVPCDVSDPKQVTHTSQLIHSKWGSIHLLINNAGENPYQSFQETTHDEFLQTFRVNCLSAVLCTKAVLPGMLANKAGAIVNVSSIYGRCVSSASIAYTVSKHALTGLTDSLRHDLAGSGVHVMGVYPGYIVTPMTAPFVTPGSLRNRLGKSPEDLASVILKGLKQQKREILYPWYVPWVWRLNQWFPNTLVKLRSRFGR